MSRIDIGEGAGQVWIVWAQEHDRSGDPEFLGAYDTQAAAESLKLIIERAGSYRAISVTAVPLYPKLVVKAP